MSERRFPIMMSGMDALKASASEVPSSVPWDLVEPHDAQARLNHSQTVQRLAERGGLSPSELVAVLEDRPWRSMPLFEALHRLRFFLKDGGK